jgi:hypothetical protein
LTTSIIITDTGKRRTTSVSAEETDKANSGSAFTLKGVEVSLEENALLNTNPAVLKLSGGAATMFGAGEVDHLGIQKPKWTMNGILKDSDATDMAKVKVLRDLVRTKGYKTLGGDVPDYVDGASNSSTVNVRIESVKLTHRSNSDIIDYQITAYETD